MRILVTGGAGFIGSNFLNLFVPKTTQHTFVSADALTYAANIRNLSPIAHAPNYTFEHGDIADLDAVMALFERHRPELVVHFAAESHVDRTCHRALRTGSASRVSTPSLSTRAPRLTTPSASSWWPSTIPRSASVGP